jgi:hypothetical protein
MDERSSYELITAQKDKKPDAFQSHCQCMTASTRTPIESKQNLFTPLFH